MPGPTRSVCVQNQAPTAWSSSAEKAHEEEHERDHEMHRNHMLEIASGGLQIAIVLASISVVINLPAFMMVSVLRWQVLPSSMRCSAASLSCTEPE